ncbi:trehalose-phosphatase [Edaphobacter sp. HDX4]|uniref:trehalose-phosphatase n=1 Tax=Edaphobacter sp. HDX4 TaxID=2794064 RepID=UPI002FE632C8
MQQGEATEIISAFLGKVAAAPSSVLLLDYDGTLAPFQIERDQAYPYPGILPLLQAIQSNGRTSLIVITGRPIHEVQNLLSPLTGIEIWGAHGLDHLLADGTRQKVDIAPQLSAALTQAEQFLHSHGMHSMTEVKPGGVAVHWRGLPDHQIESIRSQTLEGWSSLLQQEGLKLLQFEGGLELRVTRPDKGDAIATILEGLQSDTPVAFLGDDLTDEDGFRRLAHRGLSVLVRNEYRETAAQAWIRPPLELIAFLERWLQQINGA